MPTPVLRNELPQTLTRLKWQAKIKAGLDTSEILGLGKNSSTSRALAQAMAGSLEDVGAIENLDFTQNRTLVERYGFSSASHVPFQTVPVAVAPVTLKLSRVVLFNKTAKIDQVFNFTPNNILFQQIPFLIHLSLPGQNGGQNIDHYFLGCWFVDSHMNFSMASNADQRVIMDANIKVTSLLTLDGSLASLDGVNILQDTVGGVLTAHDNQAVLDDFNLT